MSWPLFCVSIGFTKDALQALRSGRLNKKCNKRNTVLGTLHELHRALFSDFAAMQLADSETHHAVHLQRVRVACENDPPSMINKYTKAKQGRPADGD